MPNAYLELMFRPDQSAKIYLSESKEQASFGLHSFFNCIFM
jgi:hypothetical protein